MEITNELIADVTAKFNKKWTIPINDFVHVDNSVFGVCPYGIYRFIEKGDYYRNKYNGKLEPENLERHIRCTDCGYVSSVPHCTDELYNILVSQMKHETVTIADFDFPVITEEVIADIMALFPSNLVYTDYIPDSRWHLVNEETGLIKRENSDILAVNILSNYGKLRGWSTNDRKVICDILKCKYKTNKNLTDSDFE